MCRRPGVEGALGLPGAPPGSPGLPRAPWGSLRLPLYPTMSPPRDRTTREVKSAALALDDDERGEVLLGLGLPLGLPLGPPLGPLSEWAHFLMHSWTKGAVPTGSAPQKLRGYIVKQPLGNQVKWERKLEHQVPTFQRRLSYSDSMLNRGYSSTEASDNPLYLSIRSLWTIISGERSGHSLGLLTILKTGDNT